MRTVPEAIVGSMLAMLAAGSACARAASAPASAPEPLTAASKAIPTRNAAITAAENAKEPGAQRPEERVIPQISVPLRSRNITAPVASSSSSAGGLPGAVNDAAARCLAANSAAEKAACERGKKSAEPLKAVR